MQVMEALTALDIANARSRHAAWMSATRPEFVAANDRANSGCMSVLAARHPLLLQRVLSALPAIPGQDASADEFSPAQLSSRSDTISGSADSHADQQGEKAGTPQPVDVLVPPGVRVAAVTGPNTGGAVLIIAETEPALAALSPISRSCVTRIDSGHPPRQCWALPLVQDSRGDVIVCPA